MGGSKLEFQGGGSGLEIRVGHAGLEIHVHGLEVRVGFEVPSRLGLKFGVGFGFHSRCFLLSGFVVRSVKFRFEV